MMRKVKMIETPSLPAVHFHREVAVVHDDGICRIPELGLEGRGESERAAMAQLVRAVREEVERLRTTPTHKLGEADVDRKGMLLGAVDPVASGLLGDVLATTWIMGEVVVGPDGAAQVREVGSDGRVFDVPPELAPLSSDASARLVCVVAGPAGEAVGPVVELEEPLGGDPDATWAAWQRRTEEAHVTRYTGPFETPAQALPVKSIAIDPPEPSLAAIRWRYP